MDSIVGNRESISISFRFASGEKITRESITRNAIRNVVPDDDAAELMPIGGTLVKRIGEYLGCSVGATPRPNSVLKAFTLPNLGKAVFRTSKPNLGKVAFVRSQPSKLTKLNCWITQRFTCDNGKSIVIDVPNWPQGLRLGYCPITAEMYIKCDSGVIAFNLETFAERMLMRNGKLVESINLADCDTLWLPLPTHRDLCVKYVPVLEANTNLPTDLCRLVASYLDW